MIFATAFDLVIGHERGYANDPNDPGGETKWGISKRSYPSLDIKNLTRDDAYFIYLRDYWKVVGADDLPQWCRFDMFDAAVHSGTAQSKRWMQFAVGVSQDGIIGPHSRAAIRRADPVTTLVRFNAARLMFMTKRKNWKHHGRGWAVRMAKNLYRVGTTHSKTV